jgi:hypothetical protein
MFAIRPERISQSRGMPRTRQINVESAPEDDIQDVHHDIFNDSQVTQESNAKSVPWTQNKTVLILVVVVILLAAFVIYSMVKSNNECARGGMPMNQFAQRGPANYSATYNNLPVPTQQQMQQAQQAQQMQQAQAQQAQQAQAQAQQAQKPVVPKQTKSEYQLIAERTAANLNKKDKITIVEEEPVVEESKKQELSDKELKTSDMKLIQQLDMNLLQDAEFIAREE